MSDQVKIDEVDARILKTLLRDVRTSFSEIAKDCGMSSNAIRIRFERLKKSGVITGSITQVSPKKFGYDCVAFLLIKAEANNESEVYEFVQKMPNLGCFKPLGRYNIQTMVAFKNLDELANRIEQIKSHPKVLAVKEIILTNSECIDHPENLVIKPLDALSHISDDLSENNNHTIIQAHPEKVEKTDLEETDELDDIDLAIIEILSENASISFRKIAKKVGISTQLVIKRYKRMDKTVLPLSSITVNLRKLGYKGLALLLVRTSKTHTISKVVDEVVQIPNIIVSHKCVGAVDMYLVVPFFNVKELLAVRQRIRNTPGIKEIELSIDEPFLSWPLNLFAQHYFKIKAKQTKK